MLVLDSSQTIYEHSNYIYTALADHLKIDIINKIFLLFISVRMEDHGHIFEEQLMIRHLPYLNSKFILHE